MTLLALGLLAWAAAGSFAALYLSRLFRAQRARLATMRAALESARRTVQRRKADADAADTAYQRLQHECASWTGRTPATDMEEQLDEQRRKNGAAFSRFLDAYAARVGDADPIEVFAVDARCACGKSLGVVPADVARELQQRGVQCDACARLVQASCHVCGQSLGAVPAWAAATKIQCDACVRATHNKRPALPRERVEPGSDFAREFLR